MATDTMLSAATAAAVTAATAASASVTAGADRDGRCGPRRQQPAASGRDLWLNAAAAAAGLTYSAYRQLRAARTLPPGPWGVPFLGYEPFLSTHCTYLKYNELARRYGPICSFTQRGNTVVLLSDHRLIKTAFDMKQITGRPNDGYMDIIGGYGEP